MLILSKAQHLYNLEKLIANKCDIKEAGIEHLANGFENFQNLKRLELT